jgi:hypothetical protein
LIRLGCDGVVAGSQIWESLASLTGIGANEFAVRAALESAPPGVVELVDPECGEFALAHGGAVQQWPTSGSRPDAARVRPADQNRGFLGHFAGTPPADRACHP